MKLLRRLFVSSLGKKFIMAVTGACLFLFVAGHMVGNLQFLLGAEPINRYAHFLQGLGELLWVVRLALVTIVGLHIWSAVALTLENRAARPVAYDQATLAAATYASRTMIWSGFIIAAFIIFHLLHYTVKTQGVNLTGKDFTTFHTTLVDGTACHDVHKMMVAGFSHPLVSGFYVLAVGLLCLHLSHGISALFQSLGLKDQTWGPIIDRFSMGASWVLFLGYAAIPTSVLLGLVK